MTKPIARGPRVLDPWLRPLLFVACVVVAAIKDLLDWNPVVAAAVAASVLALGAVFGVFLVRRLRRAQRRFQLELDAQRSSDPVYRPSSRS